MVGVGLSNTFIPFNIFPKKLPTLFSMVPINCAAKFCLLLPNPGNKPNGFKPNPALFKLNFSFSLYIFDTVFSETLDGLFSGLRDSIVVDGLIETFDAYVLIFCIGKLEKFFCICFINDCGAPLVTIFLSVPVASATGALPKILVS